MCLPFGALPVDFKQECPGEAQCAYIFSICLVERQRISSVSDPTVKGRYSHVVIGQVVEDIVSFLCFAALIAAPKNKIYPAVQVC